MNAVPAGLVYVAGQRKRVSQANAKLLASLALYPSTWLAWALGLRARGIPHPWLAALAAGPACGWATLYAVERFRRNERDRIAWTHLMRGRPALEELREQRRAVVGSVGAALSCTAGVAAPAPGHTT